MDRKMIKVININQSEFESDNIILLNSDFELSKLNISMKNTSNSLTIKTRIFNLNACKKITMLQVVFNDITNKYFYSVDNFLNVKIRLYDSDNEYYYDGGSWIPTTSFWNTEKEACENIDKFQFNDENEIGIIIRIEKGTGFISNNEISIKQLRLLCECDLNHTEDYLYKTFCDKLKKECFGRSRYIIEVFSGSKINFLDLLQQNKKIYKNAIPFKIYNLSTDPKEKINLFANYNNDTGICQLNTNITTNCQLIIYFKYNPTVQVTRSVDYYELATLPSLTVFDFQEIIVYDGQPYGDYIFNNDTGEGYASYDPRLCTYQFQLFIDAQLNYDYLYLKEAVQKWAKENILIRTWGMDEYHDMVSLIGFNDSTIPNNSDIRHGIIRFEIQNVIFYELDSYQEFSVKNVNYDLVKKE